MSACGREGGNQVQRGSEGVKEEAVYEQEI